MTRQWTNKIPARALFIILNNHSASISKEIFFSKEML